MRSMTCLPYSGSVIWYTAFFGENAWQESLTITQCDTVSQSDYHRVARFPGHPRCWQTFSNTQSRASHNGAAMLGLV
jgi:hypothetical protein